MANSRPAGSLGQRPSPVSPGSLGIGDAADPNWPADVPGNSPGPLGLNDHADPAAERYSLGVRPLHLTLTLDKDLGVWDYDPDGLLNDPGLNPEFVEKARAALAEAVRVGLRPKVHEAYRSPEESARKSARFKKGEGGRAAAAWQSCHNYGLAMDVYLYDPKGTYISNEVKGWYKLYKQMNQAAHGFVWGEGFGSGDADHWEYHPNWPQGAAGKFLMHVREWAIAAATWTPDSDKPQAKPPHGKTAHAPHAKPPEPKPDVWMPYVWWAAGAGGTAPAAEYLAKHPAPTQAAPSHKKGK